MYSLLFMQIQHIYNFASNTSVIIYYLKGKKII